MDGAFCAGARMLGGPASAPPKAPGVKSDAMSARGPQNWASEAGRGATGALGCAFCVLPEAGRGAAALGCALPGRRRLPKARRDWRRGAPGQGSARWPAAYRSSRKPLGRVEAQGGRPLRCYAWQLVSVHASSLHKLHRA